MRELSAQSRKIEVIAGELVEAGLPEEEADDMAALYEKAMMAGPAQRAQLLAKRGVEELAKRAWLDLSPTGEAWKWRGGV
jgi:hypothetical protein